MTHLSPGARTAFVASYGRLVTDVWSDPDSDAALERDPRAFLHRYGLALPETVAVEVVRPAPDAGPSLEELVAAWEDAPTSGRFLLWVPAAVDRGDDVDERELDAIVAGLGPSSAFLRPFWSPR